MITAFIDLPGATPNNRRSCKYKLQEMADWGFAKFEDDDENEEDFDPQLRWGVKDGLIFLIDCTKPMFDSSDEESGESHFQLCMRCAKTTLQNKIISSDKDLMGVVFFGTEKFENPSEFKHIYIYQKLDQPGAERILDLEEMMEDGYKSFSKDFGHSTNFSLSEALWTCANMFATSPQKVNYKRILLFTNNDNPHAGNGNLQRQARTKASDLNETGIDLELMHLQQPGEDFEVSKFYKDLLYTADDELTDLPDPSERLEELLSRVRSKDHKKRANRHIPLCLGPGLDLGVGVYNLVRRLRPPYPVKLCKKTNDELKSHSKTYLTDTGEVLMPQDLKKAQYYGGKRICFENDEVAEMKRFEKPGFYLMGFKPANRIKRHHHVRPSSFIYPDESNIIGSTTCFTALMKESLESSMYPICKHINGKNVAPRFVALIPQEEVLDENKVQITPPGFHVIVLPFADDFRKVKLEPTPKANSDQIAKAKELIKKLQFPFTSESFENPVLQNYWRNVEALALDRDAPEEMNDYTLPNEKQMDKRAGKLLTEFSDMVFPDGYDPTARKKSGLSADEKKAKAEEALLLLDAQKEAKEGRLGKLTVAILKEIVKREKITTTASKKADIIEAINNHFGIS
ncbi:hypothetical protein ScPMuIL_015523 [Solemya velum]